MHLSVKLLCWAPKTNIVLYVNYTPIVKKEKQSWRDHVAGFQAVLQSCDQKDSMVLAQKQTHRPMEQENPEMDPRLFGQLIFEKAGKSSGDKIQSLQ